MLNTSSRTFRSLPAFALLSFSSLLLSGAHANAQVSFYPVKSDPALDRPDLMGSQSLRWLRSSGTKLFGSIVDNSQPSNESFGDGRWGLDGVVNWRLTSQSGLFSVREVGEDGESRLELESVDPFSGLDRHTGVFADGTRITASSFEGFYSVISPDGMSIFGVELDDNYNPEAVYRYRPGQASVLVDGTLPFNFRPAASNFDGSVLIGLRGSGELARWTEGAGIDTIMQTGANGSFGAFRMAISHDGSVIVGRNPANFPAIWRDGLGIQVLDDCPLSPAGFFLLQCSGDGQRIDVWNNNQSGYSWDAAAGWQSFEEVLEGAGARSLSNLSTPVLYGHRTRDGAAMTATFVESLAPLANVLQQTVAFIGTPSPGALGSNYCGPSEFNFSGFSALLQATGSTSVQANSLGMTARFLPPQSNGYVLSSPGSGFAPMPANSQGNLCLGGGQHVGGHSQPGEIGVANGDGTIDFTIDLTSLPGPAMSYAAQPGDTLNFQVWFRDIDLNGAPTSNFTDAVSVTFE